MTNDLPTLSDHVLHWLLTEEEISADLRSAIQCEQARRSLPQLDGGMVTLTSKMLHDASTRGYHGFNAKQIAVFGIKWPPKRGWLKSLVGATVPEKQYLEFVKAGKKNVPQT